MLIDTHAHLNFNAFKDDFDKVIQKSLRKEVWIINIGSNYESSKKAVDIAKKYSEGVYAAIGLHPINLNTGLVKIKTDESEGEHFEKGFDYQKYKELARSKKVVAIGEIGLDYYWKPKTTKKKELFKEKQKELFLKELALAEELNLPVIFHCRVAHNDLIKILIEHLTSNIEQLGVIHGFVGTSVELQEYLKMGFYIGFNGIIFKSIEKINFEENIKKTPLDKILIETDCPYLAPPPFEGKRNEPLYVKYIAKKIAEIKNKTFEEIAEITTQNAKKLFGI